MKEYVLKVIEKNSNMFTEQDINFIQKNASIATKIYQVALVNALEDLKRNSR